MRKLKDVVSAYIAIKKLGNPTSAPTDEEARELPNTILSAERLLLQTLYFDLHTLHPYSHVYSKWKALFQKCASVPEQTKDDLMQTTLNLVNDSYRTDLCLQYRPDLIAHAAIYLATLHLDVKPEVKQTSRTHVQPNWIDLIETPADEDTLRDICNQLLDVMDRAAAGRSDGRTDYKLTRARLLDEAARCHSSPNAIASGQTPNTVSGYQEEVKKKFPPPPPPPSTSSAVQKQMNIPPPPPSLPVHDDVQATKRQKINNDEYAIST